MFTKKIYWTPFGGLFKIYFQLQLVVHYKKFLIPFFITWKKELELRRKNQLTGSHIIDTTKAKSFLLTRLWVFTSIGFIRIALPATKFCY